MEWSYSAGIRAPSISELRNLSDHVRVAPKLKTGRACTFEKLDSLAIGLRKIVGDKIVTDNLIGMAENESDIDKKFVLLELAINSSSKWKKEKAIEGMLRILNAENKPVLK